MDTMRYVDAAGREFLEIVTRQYVRLRELQVEYERRGAKTWFNMFDACEGTWVLTVMK